MSVPEDGTCRRLTAVFQCISGLWRDRVDGRFEALERALIDVLDPPKKRKPARQASSAGDNVIVLTPARVTRMRRKA